MVTAECMPMFRLFGITVGSLVFGTAQAADQAVCPSLGTVCSALPIACTHTDLDAAVGSANNGDTIYVVPGDYGNAHNVDKDVAVTGIECPAEGLLGRPRFDYTNNDTIDFEGGVTASMTFIEVDGGNRCIRVRGGSSVTFTDIVVRNCVRTATGVGLHVSHHIQVDENRQVMGANMTTLGRQVPRVPVRPCGLLGRGLLQRSKLEISIHYLRRV